MNATRAFCSSDLMTPVDRLASHRSRTLILTPNHTTVIFKSARPGCLSNTRELLLKSLPSMHHTKMFVTRCGSVPSGPTSDSWKLWLLGGLISLIIPIWKNKWSPLLVLKNKVDAMVESLDTVVEVVGKVAEEAEKVAENLAEKLPKGGKLRNAIDLVKGIAKEVAEDAQLADEMIHKAEEVEKEVEKDVEAITEAIMDQKKEGKEVSDKS